MSTRVLRCGVVQMNSGEDEAANVRAALGFLEKAADLGAEFVVFPEMFHFRGDGCAGRTGGALGRGHLIEGPFLTPFLELARQYRIWVCMGSFIEAVLGEAKPFNTSVMMSPEGKIAYVYRKIHLFDAMVNGVRVSESSRYSAGSTPVLATIHESIRVGMSICYDLRFGEMYRDYSRLGADVMLVPSSFTSMTGRAHWHVLCRARAIEHHCFVLAPNQVGVGAQGVETFGHSLIVDPWGTVLAQGSATDPELLMADLDIGLVQETRNRFSISH